MKLLHTSDWHLGRLLHSQSLLDDQRHLLDQITDLAIAHKVSAVLVAGDIFDRAIPPPDAITTLSRTIERLCLETGIPVIMITGNHDSEDRMDFMPSILKQGRFHLRTRVTADIEPVQIDDGNTHVAIYPLPYAGPARMREALQDDTVTDHNSGMQRYAERVLAGHDTARRSLLVAHGWVTGGDQHGEERPLTVGTTGQVEASVLEGFDYVAMGHLHRRQTVGDKQIIGYPGSLMQYDFGERTIKPVVNLLTIEGVEPPTVEHLELTPLRLLHTIRGSFEELLDAASEDERREHYVRVVLTDDHPIHNPFSRLKDFYPFLLHLEYAKAPEWRGVTADRSFTQIREASELELFDDFFKAMNDRPLDGKERELLTTILSEMNAEETAQ